MSTTEQVKIDCEQCGAPMAIGIRAQRVVWRCMSPQCEYEIVTDTIVCAPDTKEPKMGRKRKDPQEKRKPIKVRPIARKHNGKITEPYRIMEDVIKAHHAEIASAIILLCWRKGWRPDVDRVLTQASIRKASDVDQAIMQMADDGHSYDFVIQLNEEIWPGLSDEDKRRLIDHELCHAAPDIDRDGKQKFDQKDRPCWRLRKHPICEFPEILERYGVDHVLGFATRALEAMEAAKRPLFRPDSSDPAEWRNAPVDGLTEGGAKISPRHLDALRAAGIKTLGQLADRMDLDLDGTWWHRNIKGIGREIGQVIADALGEIRCGSQAAN